MSLYMKAAAITALLIFSIFGQQSGTYKSPKAGNKGNAQAYNKSPCFREEVLECQASGGRFNWSNCTCEYW
jgi:hypothetical protein